MKFEYHRIKDQLTVYADRIRIGQVISNLIDNSIKFISKQGSEDGDEKGTISIFIEKTKTERKISIQ